MKRFNPEKELNKIRNGNKKKVIISISTLLLVGVIGYSFALYQVRHTKELTHITVKQFYQNDLDLAVYVDGVKKVTEKEFPTKENGTNLVYTGIKCEDGKEVKASWNYDTWSLDVESNLPNKCNVYFETRWKDSSGASYPELYQGMIPITIGTNGELTVADVTNRWYSYNDHEWANAILIDDKTNHNKYYNEDGTYKKNTPIPIDDVLQMYVWIPRYRYKLFNAINGENSNPQMIDIVFENNATIRSLGQTNGEWLTHPAFLFGDTELNGFWVGKFEPSDPTDPNGRANNFINEITILPDKTSMVLKTIKTMFDAEQEISKEGNKYNLDDKEVDTRVIRNSEWGAIAYLTSSKYGIYNSNSSCVFTDMDLSNCEVWINNSAQGTSASEYGGTYTGCVGDSVSADTKWGQGGINPATCPETNRWETAKGVHASTTGNVYGVYDMSGGTWEYVMGVTKAEVGDVPNWSTNGFDGYELNSKYYDLYDFIETYLRHEKGHLGDATRETLSIFGERAGGWNKDIEDFPYVNSGNSWPWFIRGGRYNEKTDAGIFAIGRMSGFIHKVTSFRSALSAQDN